MDSCDILIVGGGPAGSSCAWGLRSSNLDVVIADRATFPREKLCGGWITPQVLQALEINPTEYANAGNRDARILQPITGFRVSCLGQPDVAVHYGRAVSYGIRRCEFDNYLLRRCGARLREGKAVNSIEQTRDGDIVVNGEIKTRLLVGAGGHFCPVSRWMGNHDHVTPVLAQEIEFEMDEGQAAGCAFSGEVPELFFCRDIRGYGWVFRKGNYLNIGLGRLDKHALGGHMSGFVQSLRREGKLGFDLPSRPGGHAYLLFGHSQRKLVGDGVILIGDAAGLAYSQSGEGIRTAVESGLIAAEVIRGAAGKYGRERLQPYIEHLQHRFHNGSGKWEALGRHVPRAVRDACARLLLRNRRFCRDVIVESWFLHRGDQALSFS
ncbi:MAG TPA: NAD(P)/FAD-dependent oxidoreductase [Terriglobales bacterium]|nr:NAD(P)/FAD-dependent oxidoreductase [Terriglobales bacterium]